MAHKQSQLFRDACVTVYFLEWGIGVDGGIRTLDLQGHNLTP